MERRSEMRLEQLLAEFDRLGVSRQVGFEKLHLYSIITHSTAIEGSTITLDENTVMFDDGILPANRQVREQMMNLDLKRAYEVAVQVASARTVITLPLLKAFSSLVMRNTGTLYRTPNGEYDESKGDLRLLNVSAGRGGRSYLPWEKVEPRTKEFLAWLNDRLAHIDAMSPAAVYDLSFEAHYRLVTIHPWSDGNGRVARLMMNLVQMEGGVVPSIVRSDLKARYIKALREAQEEGTSSRFLLFMTDELLDDLKRTIDEFAASLARDVPWSDGHSGTDSSAHAPPVPPRGGAGVVGGGGRR
ncbi:MAG: Fic family protein, partial [Coriobacteriales bacterium]|nr:Fic family protein [Coriobacteriales bacterium]